MSEHRPTAALEGDVFPEADKQWTPEQVAEAFWEDVQSWVDNGYLLVVTVTMEDGSTHEVDLERVTKARLSS